METQEHHHRRRGYGSRVRERGFEPIGEYKNTQTPWKMRHSCGAIVTPSLTNLRGGTGCKACNSTFNYMEEAIVYLLKNTALNALKVGVAGKDSGNRRINDSLLCLTSFRLGLCLPDKMP